jgi:hypothetical protein
MTAQFILWNVPAWSRAVSCVSDASSEMVTGGWEPTLEIHSRRVASAKMSDDRSLVL